MVLVFSFILLPLIEDVSGKTVQLFLDNPYDDWNNKKITYHIDLTPNVYRISVLAGAFDPDLWVKVATDSSFKNTIHENDNPGYDVDEIFNIAVYKNQTIYIKVGAANDDGTHEIIVSRVHSTPNLTIMPFPDQTIKNTTSGNNIIWFILDSGIDNTSYEIYRNKTLIEQGNWTTGSLINTSIDGLKVGNYNYTIIAYDGLDEYKTDSVIIEIIDGRSIFQIDEYFILWIFLAFSALLFLVVEVKRRHITIDLDDVTPDLDYAILVVGIIITFYIVFLGRILLILLSRIDIGPVLEDFIRSMDVNPLIQFMQPVIVLLLPLMIIVGAILVTITGIVNELQNFVQYRKRQIKNLVFFVFVFLFLVLLWLIVLLRIDIGILLEDFIQSIDLNSLIQIIQTVVAFFAPLIIIAVVLLVIIIGLFRVRQKYVQNKKERTENRDKLDQIQFFIKSQSPTLESHESALNGKLSMEEINELTTKVTSLKSKIPILPDRKKISKSDIYSYNSLSERLVGINNKCENLLEKLDVKGQQKLEEQKKLIEQLELEKQLKLEAQKKLIEQLELEELEFLKQSEIRSNLEQVEQVVDNKLSELEEYEITVENASNVEKLDLLNEEIVTIDINIPLLPIHTDISPSNEEFYQVVEKKCEDLTDRSSSLLNLINAKKQQIQQEIIQREIKQQIKANNEKLKEISKFIDQILPNLQDYEQKIDSISNQELLAGIKENINDIRQNLPSIPPSFIVSKEEKNQLSKAMTNLNYIRNTSKKLLREDIPWKEVILTKLEKFIKLIKRATSIRMEYMAEFLGYDISTLLEFLTDLPDEYDITIDGENVIFGQLSSEDGMMNEMIKQLSEKIPSKKGIYDAIIVDLNRKGHVDETELHFIINILHKRLGTSLKSKLAYMGHDPNLEYFEVIDQACDYNIINSAESDLLHSYRKIRNEFIHGKREIIPADQIIATDRILRKVEKNK